MVVTVGVSVGVNVGVNVGVGVGVEVTVVNILCGQDKEYSQAVPRHGASTTTLIKTQPSGLVI